MTTTLSFEPTFTKLKSVWANFLKDAQETQLDIDYFAKYPFLNIYDNNNIGVAILDVKNYKSVFRNNYYFELYGISKEDYAQEGDLSVLTRFNKDFVEYNALLSKYMQQVWSSLSYENKTQLRTCTSGLHYDHPFLGARRIFMQSFVFIPDENQFPYFTLMLQYDMTYLCKNADYWFRVFCESEPDKTIAYHSAYKEILKGDILSKREKEILDKIIKGKTTDEIASELFISKTTVNNHRQNMLDRLEVKDTTALIELSKLAKII